VKTQGHCTCTLTCFAVASSSNLRFASSFSRFSCFRKSCFCTSFCCSRRSSVCGVACGHKKVVEAERMRAERLRENREGTDTTGRTGKEQTRPHLAQKIEQRTSDATCTNVWCNKRRARAFAPHAWVSERAPAVISSRLDFSCDSCDERVSTYHRQTVKQRHKGRERGNGCVDDRFTKSIDPCRSKKIRTCFAY
jgi:hypothetical protein